MKQATETVDDLYNKEVYPLKVTEEGLLGKKILVDTEARDLVAFWKTKERLLTIITVGCCLYFLGIILGEWLLLMS